jgi:hypothetical protein
MGCGETLVLDTALTRRDSGRLWCSSPDCPQPTAAHGVLSNDETEHVVVFDERGFSIQHPLRERVEDALFECGLHEDMRALDGPPGPPGRYRATRHEPDAYSESYRGGEIGWDFERIGP